MKHLNETIIENVHVALAVLDTSLNVLQSNDRFSDIFAQTREVIVNAPLRDLSGGEQLEAAVVRALSTGEAMDTAGMTLRVGAASDRRFLLTASRIKLTPARAGILVTLNDFTESKLGQLRQTEADRTLRVTEIVADIAHEINNPLAAIMGFAQLALQRDVEPVLREYLKTVHSQAQKASGIIAKLQSFTLESRPTKEPTDEAT